MMHRFQEKDLPVGMGMNRRYVRNDIGLQPFPWAVTLVGRATAVVALVLVRLGPAFALPPDFKVDRALDLNIEITCLQQDRDGFLWIGTKGKGVARHDAYTLRYYRGTEFGVQRDQ